MTYICARTGETFVNKAIADSIHGAGYCDNTAPATVPQVPIAIPVSESSPGGIDTRQRDAAGNLVTNQNGSQFWMNAGYTGVEPPLEVKAIFSSADYARDWAGQAVRAIPGAVLSPAMQLVQKYPTTENTAEIWKILPELDPANNVQYATPVSSPGSTNEPAYMISEAANKVSNAVGTVTSGLGQYAVVVVIGIVAVVVYLVFGRR